MFAKMDAYKNRYMLTGFLAEQGYDWWWHSFTGIHEETGEERAFFIEYYLCNPALSGAKPKYGRFPKKHLRRSEPVLGQLPENKALGKKPSYMMVKAGCWGEEHLQLHRFFAWRDVEVRTGAPYGVKGGDCIVSEDRIQGHVTVTKEEAAAHPEYMCDSGEMSWDLVVDKKIAYNVGYGTSVPLCAMEAFEMYWHAQGMKTHYSGVVTLNGERYIVIPGRSYGYADKNWGRDFTSPWVWLASSDLRSNLSGKRLLNSAFDIGGGRPKVYALPLPQRLLGAFYYEGEEFEFNFSKFWNPTRTKFHCQETKEEIIWKVTQENRDAIMKVRVTCCKKDMLFVNYESPDGEKRHNRLWNGGNAKGRILLYRKIDGKKVLVDDIEAGHIGCEYGVYDGFAQL
ncbi:MAG: hypothetical protein HUJ72_05360 [Blautia sp.]|nr:hypothetical protein [Blautia sp.]